MSDQKVVWIKCTVNDKPGKLVPVDELDQFMEKQMSTPKALKDWYQTAFYYDKSEVTPIFKERSGVQRYEGVSLTNYIHWDIDSKEDLELARTATKLLIDWLAEKEWIEESEVYFSGNKGFHVLTKVQTEINPKQTKDLAFWCAAQAKVPTEVLDAVVYNNNRLFRIVNTKHQSSGLFKIPLHPEEVYDLTMDEIKELAETSRTWEDAEWGRASVGVDITEELKQSVDFKEKTIVVDSTKDDVQELIYNFKSYTSNNTNRRNCIQNLENGLFDHGERNDALLRMASYHKYEGKTQDESRDIINRAFALRAERLPDTAPIDDHETEATLDHIFSPKWTGGCYPCKTDEFLQKTCELSGECGTKKATRALGKGVCTIKDINRTYIQYGYDVDGNHPKFGLPTLDKLVRMRPKQYSVVNAAPGCVDKDTEFMTPTGWKKISEWNGEQVLQFDVDTGSSSFCTPSHFIKKPCDWFYEMRTDRGINQRLSPEHTVLYYSDRHNPMTCSMEEFYQRHKNTKSGIKAKIKTTFGAPSTDGIDLTNEQIRVMLAIIADGTFNNNTNRCTIRLKKDRKKLRLERLLEEAGIEYTKKACNGKVKGFHRYIFLAPRREKHFSAYWYNCNENQLKVISEAVLHWGGSGNRFSTAIKESADFIQWVFSAMGYRSTISINDRVGQKQGKSIEYSVSKINQEFTCTIGGSSKDSRGELITKVKSEDGFKYCFTVPTGFLVLRRNGKIFTTGNSGKTSLVINIIDYLNEEQIPHLFLSLDMSDTALFEKLGSRYTNYSTSQIEKAFAESTRDSEIMEEVMSVLVKRLPHTYFDFTSTMSTSHVEKTIKNLNMDLEVPLQIVFLDYAGRIVEGLDSAYANHSMSALRINDICKSEQVHIMVLSQIARDKGDHTTPLLSSRIAEGSGQWEQNATFSINLWRPFGDGISGEDRYMNMYIGKNRSGKVAELYFGWNGSKGEIYELDDAQMSAYVEQATMYNKALPRMFNRERVETEALTSTEIKEKKEARKKARKPPEETEETEESTEEGEEEPSNEEALQVINKLRKKNTHEVNQEKKAEVEAISALERIKRKREGKNT